MEQYAMVYFPPEEAEDQKMFLKAMAGVNIIRISKEDIRDVYSDMLRERTGHENRLVLKDEMDRDLFVHVMKVFFPKKGYKLSADPEDRMYEEWLKRGRGGHDI